MSLANYIGNLEETIRQQRTELNRLRAVVRGMHTHETEGAWLTELSQREKDARATQAQMERLASHFNG